MSENKNSRLRRTRPIVDAHQHFWDLRTQYRPWLCDEPPPRLRYGDYSPLRRNYLAQDYRRDTADFDVAGTVYVEAEWDPRDPTGETAWVHELSTAERLPTAMVAQAWLDREDVKEVIARQAAFPLVRGVRHKPSALPMPRNMEPMPRGSMSEPQWRNGYALLERYGLSFDLQVPWWHLPEAAELAADFPSVAMAVNHAGQVDSRDREVLGGWRNALEIIARQSNVVLKISGLGLAGRPWSLEDNLSVIRDAITIFGHERCLLASNYPVDSLVGTFQAIYDGFAAACTHLSEAAQDKLFHDNAVRFYRMERSVASLTPAEGTAQASPSR